MYHGRFRGTHYEVGYKWGKLLYERGKSLNYCPTFKLDEKKKAFARECTNEYAIYFPEILEEIRGIVDGQRLPVETLQTILFAMYCFELDNRCTCFAFADNNNIIFGRNSDFLVSLEKLYMNCIYDLKGSYAFNGNTTAYVEMEDGVNSKGLAAGLTFVYPYLRKPGLNAGMLVRYILEKCSTVEEAIEHLRKLPIASAQTITLADKSGDMAVVECNPERLVVIEPKRDEGYVAAANRFNSKEMEKYNNEEIDDWRSRDRYDTAVNALKANKDSFSFELARDILSGKHGFMCQYDRKTNADTVWSVIYDLGKGQIWRVEGNPCRKSFKEDIRSNRAFQA